MSTQRGNTLKNRTPKHNNAFAFKNDKYDTTGKMKAINALVVSNVCQRCKDCIEWKIKYRKYKPLTVPGKCVKCTERKVKYAYHIVCSDCSLEQGICAKCIEVKDVIGEVEKSSSEKQREENYLREELKHMRLREKRTLLRQLDRGTITELPKAELPKAGGKSNDSGVDDSDDGSETDENDSDKNDNDECQTKDKELSDDKNDEV